MLHQIGVGALGPVFRTYEPTRDRLVAVKVFRLDVIPEQARALADELARAADAGLFHPSIVEPLAAGLEGTVAYRAEEYVAAESLDVAMRHYAPAAVDKMLPFITQLASALDFARAAGVGHGALHPRDIFVTPDEARATGFGVVDALERLGLRAPVRRPYSPPERIAGQPWGTPADVFSLGVIAFELLTGRRPSGLGGEMGPLTGAALGEREGEVRAVLARAMHADPGARYATAQAFSAALAEAAGVAETAVSLAPRAIPVRPPAAPDLRIVAPPVAADVESPLAAGAGAVQPEADTVIGAAAPAMGLAEESETPASGGELALDDFAAEAEVPSPSDSPREVARKVIAAREVRKRQVKKKAAEPTPDLISGLTADEALPAEVLAAEPAPVEAEEPSDAVVEPVLDVPIAGDSISRPSDDVTAAPLLEAVELAPPARDLSERVVAVDEFRAREASSSKPERAWPRVPERPVFDKPGVVHKLEVETHRPEIQIQRPEIERAVPDRSGWAATTRSGSAIDEPLAAEGLPPAFAESSLEPHRIDMLQRTLHIGLGLVLGYAAGYFVANRDTSPTVADVTSGVGADITWNTDPDDRNDSSPHKESTDVNLTPPAAPNTPAEGTTPRPSAPAGAPVPAPAESRGATCRHAGGQDRPAGHHVESRQGSGDDQRQVDWPHAADRGRPGVREVRRPCGATRIRGRPERGRALVISSIGNVRSDAAPGEGAGSSSRSPGAGQAGPDAAQPVEAIGGDDRRDLRRFAPARGPRLHRRQGSRGDAGPVARPVHRPAGGAARTGGPPAVDRDQDGGRRGSGARHRFARTHQISHQDATQPR